MVENIIFEGGGIRAIAFGGAIKYLEEANILQNVQKLGGTSAGAIVSAALSIGYTADELVDVFQTTNFDLFKDDSWNIFKYIYRFVRHYGLYNGDALLEWTQKMVENKTGNKHTTFKDVYENYNKTLVITGSCVNKCAPVYFTHENPKYENMPIALAIRISMCVPFYWVPVVLDGDVFIDGGVLDNYPIWIFDGKYIGDRNITEEDTNNSKTIGFKLISSDNNNNTNDVSTLFGYCKSLLNMLMIEAGRRHVKGSYWDKTIRINTFDTPALDLDLSLSTKNKLIQEGYRSTKEYFQKK